MAIDGISYASSISTTSYDTALCIIIPQEQCRHIDALRSLYDKCYGKWPPHINLIYPFVCPESLPLVKERLESCLHGITQLGIQLDRSGYFEHRRNSTVFLQETNNPSESNLTSLRSMILRALGNTPTPCNFHLTIGQSEDNSESSRDFLLSKAKLIPRITFEVESLAILVREQISSQDKVASRMRLWGTIKVPHVQSSIVSPLSQWWIKEDVWDIDQLEAEEEGESDSSEGASRLPFSREIQPRTTYCFDTEYGSWAPSYNIPEDMPNPSTLTISSYNVLIDSEYPPVRDRDSLLTSTILSSAATADILVLQEVSDDFLSHLLANQEVRQLYQFVSHGPPAQPDIGPLPSLRNVVILSKWYFNWKLVPFHRRHKSATVATFPSILKSGAANLSPLIVAGIHLTCGLTDGSVAAKKVQIQNLKNYLAREHANNPWLVAGDFNITTSSYTIDTALKNKSISQETSKTLASIESMITDAGLLDTWSVARVEAIDDSAVVDIEDLFDGEEGATFNPRANVLAASTSGTSNNRPQRYDRILLRPQGALQISRFNHFGLPEKVNTVPMVPSDHSGIRTSMRLLDIMSKSSTSDLNMLLQHPVQHHQVQTSLSEPSNLVSTLAAHRMFPTDNDIQCRKEAMSLVKQVLSGSTNDGDTSISNIPMVIVPVGSYALGVWTSASDIDCLCIGSISSKTFFKLARQRIHKAQEHGVRLLRKVEANTGTMFELSVNGINMDLQYCPAATVVERWPEFHNLHPSDPIFNLPILSLRKLKPYRDISYIQRTLPSISTFRLAYRCIKLWAVQRGIYSSKFGFLGGIHIALMLSWICKRIAHDAGSVNAADLVVSFFHYYAHFDWEKDMLFDVFFHKKKPRYHRSLREHMVVLGFHAPNANIAHTSTMPGLQTLVKELTLANRQLSEAHTTWDSFFGQSEGLALATQLTPGASEFLKVHESYVKIDIQYWGRTLAKGKGLVGWVESRCLLLVVDINKALPYLNIRIWPARFTVTETDDTETDYNGCYLIGLARKEDEATPSSKEERQLAKQTIERIFGRFLMQLQEDDRFYDPSSCWIGVSLAKPSELNNLHLDNREWGDYVHEVEPESDDEEDVGDLVDEVEDARKHISRRLPIRSAPSSTSTPVSTSKLRPASDVLNRLRWDPSLDPSDYIVGYEDRFLGAKETTLEKWKTEQTDEEFIPQHRILYFKTRGGEIVWERACRIDKIFGSGAGIGEGIVS